MGSEFRPERKPPPAAKPKPARITRQKRKRMNADMEYNAVSDIFKEQAGFCARCQCTSSEMENHHIVRGTAGRSSSLLNSDTWLALCPACHEKGWFIEEQIACKLVSVLRAIQHHRARKLTDQQAFVIVREVVRALE